MSMLKTASILIFFGEEKVGYPYHPSTWETEAREFPQVKNQPNLHGMILSQNQFEKHMILIVSLIMGSIVKAADKGLLELRLCLEVS